MDGAGRLVLPKRLRERFRLRGGDSLVVAVRGDAIELRPARPGVRLQKVNGVLVLCGAKPLPGDRDLVDESREERLDELERRGKEAA
jgi:AbrB family looped-hinge helix DNA binding protein